VERAASLAAVLAERNPRVPTIVGFAEHIRGLIDGNLDALERAAVILQSSPRMLQRAEAQADRGVALFSAGRRDEGLAALDEAGKVFSAFGAFGSAEHIQRWLTVSGVRRRRWAASNRPTSGWEALTTMEQRVARLVADGRTNRAAAAELVLSPNTVATHLRSIFGKLNVASRVQLARVVMRQS
jgi:DNA-binding NarL/FixJ family response regulator